MAQPQRVGAGLRPGDTALFFFAGHGFEIRGQNFLLPADVPAVVAGALSLEDGARVVGLRSRVIAARLAGRGAMASVPCGWRRVWSPSTCICALLRWPIRLFVSFFRGTPLIAQIFLIYYGLPHTTIGDDGTAPIPGLLV